MQHQFADIIRYAQFGGREGRSFMPNILVTSNYTLAQMTEPGQSEPPLCILLLLSLRSALGEGFMLLCVGPGGWKTGSKEAVVAFLDPREYS